MLTLHALCRSCRFALPALLLWLSSGSAGAQDTAEQWEGLREAAVGAYRAGRYAEGVGFAEQALRAARSAFGDTDERTLTSLNNLAALYQSQGRYGEAEPLFEQALELRREVLGPSHPKTLTSLNNLAGLYESRGRYGEAEPLYEQALELSREVLGPRHPDTVISLNDLAFLYDSQGRYGEAEPLYEQALELSRQVLGPSHPNTLTSLNNLALLYDSQGRYGEAEPLFEQALELRREVLGSRHRDTLGSLNNLAFLYESQGRYGEAEPLYEQALELRRTVLGPSHPDTFSSLDNLAGLYSRQGRYGEAEPLFEQALELSREVLGPSHPDTLISLNNLAFLYRRQGRYGEAEPLYEQALELSREVLGPSHPNTLSSLNNLAGLYESQGRYGEAEPLYEQGLELSREVLGPSHPNTLSSLNNLAGLYESQGRYSEAEPFYEQALELRREVLGPSHPDTLRSLNNQAGLYESQGRYGEAEPLYEQALELRREVLGPSHPDTLTSLNGLAVLYERQGRYGEAEPLLEQAWSTARTILGVTHPSTLRYHLNTVVNLAAQERLDEAAGRLRQMEPQLLTWLGAELYSTKAEAVRRQLVGSQANYQHVALSLGLEDDAGAAARELGASAVLRFKGLQAEEEAFLAKVVRQGDDPEAVRLATEITDLRAELGREFHASSRTSQQIISLQQDLEERELALAQVSRAYAEQLQVRQADITQLQGSLPAGSMIIEIRRYRQVEFSTGGLSEARYAGVLVDGTEIEVVDFGLANELEEFAGTLASEGVSANRQRAASFALYNHFIAPFGDRLKDLDTLYIAPDGPLHLVPFARLVNGEGQLLAERLNVRVVQTGRDLLRPAADRPGTGLLALGGIDFDRRETQLAALDGDALAVGPFVADGNRVRSATADAFRNGFAPLPGSREEVKAIAQRYRTARPEEPVEVWDGASATEGRLKALTSPPWVLHLATHGFYRTAGSPLDRPMLLAGVSLAGANDALEEDRHDGILYAIEAQGLNLEGTELVVLSACETAQGVVDYSEGIYGLVRAFRTAGARNVLVTLRPVGDFSTRDFMTTFYEHWLDQSRSDPAAALRATQLDYIEAGQPPDTWAPYVLIGGAS